MIYRLHRLTAAAVTGWLLLAHTGRPHPVLTMLVRAVGDRWRRLRAAREDGMATLEVAILAAVLLGLATALLAAITAVVHKHQAQIK